MYWPCESLSVPNGDALGRNLSLSIPPTLRRRSGLIHDRDVFSRFSDEKWAPHAAVPGKKAAGGRGRARDSVDGGAPPERRVARAWKAQGLLLHTCTGFSHLFKYFDLVNLVRLSG